MARNLGNLIMNQLVGGLITEVGALNFPAGGATATQNCIWTQKKTVKRRLGFNFEEGFVPLGPPPAPTDLQIQSLFDLGVSSDGSKIVFAAYPSLEGAGYTGALWYSSNGGGNFTDITTPSSISDIGFIACAISGDGQRIYGAVGAPYNGITQGSPGGDIYMSSDGGLTFSNITSGSPASDAGFLDMVVSDDHQTIFASAQSGHLFSSTDAGVTWTDNGDPSGFGIGFFDFQGNSDLSIMISGTGLVSQDNGVTWVAADLGDGYVGASYVNYYSSTFYLASSFTNVQNSTSWPTINTYPMSPDTIGWSGICAGGSSIFVSGSDSANSYIYRSTDGGGSWTAVWQNTKGDVNANSKIWCSSDGSIVICPFFSNSLSPPGSVNGYWVLSSNGGNTCTLESF